jgi:hypothetical protein
LKEGFGSGGSKLGANRRRRRLLVGNMLFLAAAAAAAIVHGAFEDVGGLEIVHGLVFGFGSDAGIRGEPRRCSVGCCSGGAAHQPAALLNGSRCAALEGEVHGRRRNHNPEARLMMVMMIRAAAAHEEQRVGRRRGLWRRRRRRRSRAGWRLRIECICRFRLLLLFIGTAIFCSYS